MSDTLAALHSALSPKAGLKPIALASESYQLASLPAASERLLNLFPQKLPSGARSPFILKSTPGLVAFAGLGAGPVRACVGLNAPILLPPFRAGRYWAISGDHAYTGLDSAASPIDLGFVGIAAGHGTQAPDYNTVSIAVGLTQVVFCVPPNVYVNRITAIGGLTKLGIPINNFPSGGASSVAYIDGYFAFTNFTGTQVFVSELLDAETYNSLAFLQISAFGDFSEFVFTHNGELWVFGQTAVQPWYDTGDPTFPFAPRPGAIVKHGLGSPRSIVEIDQSLIYLSNDGCVYQVRGYTPARISTAAIEELLSGYAGGYLRGITACGWMFEGHTFYAMSLPLLGRTFVYDCAIGLWHERCSAANGTGQWQINTATHLDARVILGDAGNGTLYHIDSSVLTENNVILQRQAVLPMLDTHGPREFMNRLEIEMEVGPTSAYAAPSVVLDWSDDGGLSYKPPRTLSLGTPGATRTRVAATRLGSFRQRVLRLTMAGAATIYGVNADISPGLG